MERAENVWLPNLAVTHTSPSHTDYQASGNLRLSSQERFFSKLFLKDFINQIQKYRRCGISFGSLGGQQQLTAQGNLLRPYRKNSPSVV